MIVKKENKMLALIKRSWVYLVAGVLVIAIGTTLGIVAATRDNQGVVDVINPGGDKPEEKPDQNGDNENNSGETGENGENNEDNKPDENPDDSSNKDDKPVSTEPVSFALPMSNASVIKDYSDVKLQYNPTLDRWEAHMYVDLVSDDLSVYSVLDGTVISSDYDYLTGNIIKIEHSDGFVSCYSSLAENSNVKVGDKVTKGQKIAEASNTASRSSKYGNHLEFMLLKDQKKVDPNNYLDLQVK